MRVLLSPGSPRNLEQSVGFYTLTMERISCYNIPVKDLPKQPSAPVILLGQSGVDLRCQGHGHGKRLLYHALLSSKLAADRVGCLAVVLHAATDEARAFYLARGFEPLLDDPNHLWLSMRKIRALFTNDSNSP